MSGLEALAIVSAISACWQLADGLAELVTIITHAINNTQYIPQYIRNLKHNVQIFEVCLIKFINASDEAYSNDWRSKQARATAYAVELLVDQGDELWRKIYKLVRKAERKKFQTVASRWLNKLGLAFKHTSVQCLQTSLSSLVSNTQLLGCTVVMETLITQIRELKHRKETVPAHLERKIDQLKRELVHHKEMAMSLRRELRQQAKASGLQDEFVVELANLRQLNHCLRKKVAKVAPELTPRSDEATPRQSASSSSRHDSHVVSSHSSPVVPTPPLSPLGVGQPTGQSYRGVRETSGPTGTSVELPAILPLFEPSRSYQEAAQDIGMPIDDKIRYEQEDLEEARHIDVQHGIVGPVIMMSEDDQVKEVHRKWRPEANTSLNDEAGEMNNLTPEVPHSYVKDRDKGQQYHHSRSTISTTHNTEEQIDSGPKQGENSSCGPSQGEASEREPPLQEGGADPPTSASLCQPRMRRTRGNIGIVDIFSLSEDKTEHEDANEASDLRYKPVPPFDSSDRFGRRRPNSQ